MTDSNWRRRSKPCARAIVGAPAPPIALSMAAGGQTRRTDPSTRESERDWGRTQFAEDSGGTRGECLRFIFIVVILGALLLDRDARADEVGHAVRPESLDLLAHRCE